MFPLQDPSISFTATQIANKLQGDVAGDGSIRLTGVAAADSAQEGDLTFAEKPAYFAAAEKSRASAILVPDSSQSSRKVLIRVRYPRLAIAQLLPLFYPTEKYPPGVHPSAGIDPTAQIDPTVHIGPGCTVGAGCRIDSGSVLLGGNYLGANCRLGQGVCLHPNVVLYAKTEIGNRVTIHAGSVIGSDGYGYIFDKGQHLKMQQIGNVIIQDDVEIGANTAIDRATLGSTIIGAGTKIDNLVHIAHNVTIGKGCLVMGQAGFAGSTRLGDYCVIASQSGIAGHLELGNHATVGAKSGVMRDIPDNGTVLGIPAAPDKQAKRQMIAIQQLSELIRRVRELEKELRGQVR
jgi:UDP-3-O-[3-hydroxymyristoyl] glucosamine N-acyltransferase